MKKIFLILCVFTLTIEAYSQDCYIKNMEVIKSALITSVGEKNYSKLSINEKNKLLIQVVIDTSGKILEIKECKAIGIKDKYICKFKKTLISRYKFCVYNPESEINFEKFVEIHKGKLPYSFSFSPYRYK